MIKYQYEKNFPYKIGSAPCVKDVLQLHELLVSQINQSLNNNIMKLNV